MCAAYAVRTIAKPVAGGIFRGSSSVNGRPNFNVLVPTSGDPGAKGFCSTPRLATQLDRMFASPSGYYVDVATRRFRSDSSGGAIRGQLRSTSRGGSGALVASIKGTGDDDGFGAFTAIRDGNTLCYGLVVDNLGTVTQVAIQGTGVAAVTLGNPSSGNPGTRAGCIEGVGGLDNIFGTPADFSVSIATSDSPDGAARGQLSR